MTEQEAERLFHQLNAVLQTLGLTWLATEIAGEAAEGKASPKMLTVQDHSQLALSDETVPRSARRKTEFTHVRDLTAKEKLGIAIKALRAIVVSSGKILPEVLQTLRASPSATISFVAEIDAPPTVLSEIEARRFSLAANQLSEQLVVLGEEVSRGA